MTSPPVPPITSPATAPDTAPGIGPGLTFAMAAACGIAVANIYYNQPMLGVIEASFGDTAVAGMIPTATQLGYATGLLLLVPLGDLFEKRRLIVTQFLLLALALAATALSPTPWFMVGASFLVGTCATAAQQLVPFAAALATPEKRGATIGTVMSGLLCGILLSRTIAGFVATHAGWREMFWLSMPLALATAVVMALSLPRQPPMNRLSYGEALHSLGALWNGERALRWTALNQAALFASFSAFWAILALHLAEPAYDLGADVAGLFGIVGTVGVLVAPAAGRLADRRGPRLVILIGLLITLAGWLVFGGWNSLTGLVVGVIVMDLGYHGALIGNQSTVYALNPNARSRINTIFMTAMFLGGAAGSAGAAAAFAHLGWTGVCLFGGGLAGLSLLLAVLAPSVKAKTTV